MSDKRLSHFFVKLVIGAIGAIGQAYILHHELTGSYPYKIMDSYHYGKIAEFGVIISPILAVFFGVALGIKKHNLACIIPVVASPLLFLVTYTIFEVLGQNVDRSIDIYTPLSAMLSFLNYCSVLLVLGLITAFLCNKFINYVSNRNSLA